MPAACRLFATVGLPAAALAGAALLQLDGDAAAGLDWAALGESQRAIAHEEQRYGRMDARSRGVEQRMAARRLLAEELIAGERTLLDTAAWFHHFNGETGSRGYVESFPGRSPGEKVCRQVIHWCATVASGRSEGVADEVRGRLEDELERHLAAHGTVELPTLD